MDEDKADSEEFESLSDDKVKELNEEFVRIFKHFLDSISGEPIYGYLLIPTKDGIVIFSPPKSKEVLESVLNSLVENGCELRIIDKLIH